MYWGRFLAQDSRQQKDFCQFCDLSDSPHCPIQNVSGSGGLDNGCACLQERFQSCYVGNLARRVHDTVGAGDAKLLKELYCANDPEAVIKLYESHHSLHSSPLAVAEYVKALVKVDRLDESKLLKALQRGSAPRKEECVDNPSALRNLGEFTNHGVLGTAIAPVHVVIPKAKHSKTMLLCRAFTTLVPFLVLMFLSGAVLEHMGLNEEVGFCTESNTTFNDVKGVDEAKAELEEIVHYLQHPKCRRFPGNESCISQGLLSGELEVNVMICSNYHNEEDSGTRISCSSFLQASLDKKSSNISCY